MLLLATDRTLGPLLAAAGSVAPVRRRRNFSGHLTVSLKSFRWLFVRARWSFCIAEALGPTQEPINSSCTPSPRFTQGTNTWTQYCAMSTMAAQIELAAQLDLRLYFLSRYSIPEPKFPKIKSCAGWPRAFPRSARAWAPRAGVFGAALLQDLVQTGKDAALLPKRNS